MKHLVENAIVVRNKTRLELLIERFNSKAQAKFYIERSGSTFNEYQIEHDNFYRSLDTVRENLAQYLKTKVIERSFLPSFIFSDNDLICVIGQDGLVANTAKYVNSLPILAINPDSLRYDGVLLPFVPDNFHQALVKVLTGSYNAKKITMAEASLNDGQKLLAFNDFFIGPSSHTSARYKITHNQSSEDQSSSGIIVSTGAGSTGWLSSLFNMANSMSNCFRPKTKTSKISSISKSSKSSFFDDDEKIPPQRLDWSAKELIFVVREPFRSKYSQVNITAGYVQKNLPLQIESYMPDQGIIFSDGIEADALKFNSGSIVKIGVAKETATLVLP